MKDSSDAADVLNGIFEQNCMRQTRAWSGTTQAAKAQIVPKIKCRGDSKGRLQALSSRMATTPKQPFQPRESDMQIRWFERSDSDTQEAYQD